MRRKILYHVTITLNMDSIGDRGLDPECGHLSKRIWLCNRHMLKWCVYHLCKVHRWAAGDLVCYRVSVPVDYLHKRRYGVYWTMQHIMPLALERVRLGDFVAIVTWEG